MTTKPLGHKAYGSIPHLPGSRRGPGDHGANEGQARMCLERGKNGSEVVVQEKLDGSCCAIANIDGQIVPLSRAGYRAETSRYEQHHLFADWVMRQQSRYLGILQPGERLIGEWLAQAHGTRYRLHHAPFVAFDIMRGHERLPWLATEKRLTGRSVMPHMLHRGRPESLKYILSRLNPVYHGAIDPIEGAVWRVERKNKVLFLAKWVRPDKDDGKYLPEVVEQRTGHRPEPVWNWRPETGTQHAALAAIGADAK